MSFTSAELNNLHNCLFRTPITKNKSYSKVLYVAQSTVTITILSIIYLKKITLHYYIPLFHNAAYTLSDQWCINKVIYVIHR